MLDRPDVYAMIRASAEICQRIGFVQIEIPIFFMGIQQTERQDLERFLNDLQVQPDEVYQDVASSLNSLPRDNEVRESIPLAQSLLKAFDAALSIEQQLTDCRYRHGALYTALIMIPGPLRAVFSRRGITTSILQNVLIPAPSIVTRPVSPVRRRRPGPRRRPECPAIQANCTDLMEMAEKGDIKPAIGRDDEIRRILQTLSLYTKSNPVLVGEAGTGKTAIVEGLACRLLDGDVPAGLENLYIFQLDPSSIKNEDLLREIIHEAKENPQVVLFIDEIHMLIGKNSGANNAFANLLKPEMARGSIKILGATTFDEYTQHIEKDKAFERRFQKIIVDEPSAEACITILEGIKSRFEQHHHVSISHQAIESAVKLSRRFIPDHRLPDKAIDLIDVAASSVRMAGTSSSVTDRDIMAVISERTGIPMQNLTQDDMEQLRHIEERLHESVIGQDNAIRIVANAIRRSRMGLGDESRPIGSFLFLGTSGIGKTELCKALAEQLFLSRDAMVRIDMSEYQLEYSVARLFGAPPGYVGHDRGGQLTEAVRRKPYSLVLFDEMEKAHPRVFETLLQVLDDGRMTDGQGRTVDFRNTIIVMTSNMGQDVIARNLIGPDVTEQKVTQTTNEVMALLKRHAAPEFWGRVDHVVMFMPLNASEVLQITDMQLKAARKRMEEQGICVHFEEGVAKYIARHAYEPQYGARSVKKMVSQSIVDVIATMLANGQIMKERPVICSVQDESIVIHNQ